MPDTPASLAYYDDTQNAQRYHARTGFDPARKQEMLDVTLRLLTELAPAGARLLELGCGSGLFTAILATSGHFGAISATDGAEAMLEIARSPSASAPTPVVFETLDFTRRDWASQYPPASFDAVTSSMALHHAVDKQRLFSQVYEALAPGGVFVFADHMAGSSASIERLIDRERARIKLGKDEPSSADIKIFIESDRRKQAAQGNHCESVADYLGYLEAVGFVSVDCLWRSFWLAVFVAQKPG